MNLASQKRIAAEIFKVGVNRVKIDPDQQEEISQAITREDIRALIETNAIYATPEKGNSKARLKHVVSQKRKGRRAGQGTRSGKRYARQSSKEKWMKRIRALRDELKKLRTEGKIDASTYRQLYRQAKGNLYHSRRHLREHLERAKS